MLIFETCCERRQNAISILNCTLKASHIFFHLYFILLLISDIRNLSDKEQILEINLDFHLNFFAIDGGLCEINGFTLFHIIKTNTLLGFQVYKL